MDVVARLKSIAVLKTGEALPEWAMVLKTGEALPEWAMGANGWGDALSKMCTDAIAEIEHLRSLAGAVSQGSSFDDIRRKQGEQRWRDGHVNEVLKAFDGS